MSHVARVVGFALCCPLLPVSIQAQLVGGRIEALHTFSTGNNLAAAGDVDKDGVPDLVVGDPQAITLATNAGEVSQHGATFWHLHHPCASRAP